MALADKLGDLKNQIESATADAQAVDGGNKAAATRFRKAMQTAKDMIQELRVGALEATKKKG